MRAKLAAVLIGLLFCATAAFAQQKPANSYDPSTGAPLIGGTNITITPNNTSGATNAYTVSAAGASGIVPPAGDITGSTGTPSIRTTHLKVRAVNSGTSDNASCSTSSGDGIIVINVAQTGFVENLPSTASAAPNCTLGIVEGSGTPNTVIVTPNSGNSDVIQGPQVTSATSVTIVTGEILWVQFTSANTWQIINMAPSGGGDLTGPNGSWTVTGINGVPLSGSPSTTNQVYAYNSGSNNWQLVTLVQYPQITALNNGTGTTANDGAIFDTSGEVQVAGTGSTTGVIGIVTAGAGTTGTATIQIGGLVTAAFDGSTTAGDAVIASTTSGGKMHDCGSAACAASGSLVQILGVVPTTNSGAGSYQFFLTPQQFEKAPSSYTDTTSASNISSGTLSPSRLTANTTLEVNPTGATSTAFAGTANAVSCSQFQVQWPLSVGELIVDITTQDATTSDYYDIGIFNSSNTLVANLGNASNGVNFTTQAFVKDAFSQGTVTLNPGLYNLCFTGSATTAHLALTGNIFSVTNSSSTSTNGTFTGYTLTMGTTPAARAAAHVTLVP